MAVIRLVSRVARGPGDSDVEKHRTTLAEVSPNLALFPTLYDDVRVT